MGSQSSPIPMGESLRSQPRTEPSETLETKAERPARLEAIDALFALAPGHGDSSALLRNVADILKDSVPCDAVSIEPIGDDAAALAAADVQLIEGPRAVVRLPASAGGRVVAMIAMTA